MSSSFSFDQVKQCASPTGANLTLYHQPAKISKGGAAKGIVQINHGLAEHAQRYARFATALAQAGYHVYAHDHRGHGTSQYTSSKPSTSQLGVFADHDTKPHPDHGGWDLVIKDIETVRRMIKKAHPQLPHILFGHSMGAILTYHYALTNPNKLDGLVVWNTAISGTSAAKTLQRFLAVESLFKNQSKPSLASKLTFDSFNKKLAPTTTSVDWLSKDMAECQAYENDPLCGWPPSISMWRGLAHGLTMCASDQGLENFDKSLPVHLLAGDDDPSAGYGKPMLDLQRRLKAAELINVQCSIRAGGRHEALNEPEVERGQVTQDFIQWLDQHYA